MLKFLEVFIFSGTLVPRHTQILVLQFQFYIWYREKKLYIVWCSLDKDWLMDTCFLEIIKQFEVFLSL